MPQFLHPTIQLPDGRRLSFLDRKDGMVKYTVLGSDASPVWVSVESLRPFVNSAKVLQQ